MDTSAPTILQAAIKSCLSVHSRQKNVKITKLKKYFKKGISEQTNKTFLLYHCQGLTRQSKKV